MRKKNSFKEGDRLEVPASEGGGEERDGPAASNSKRKVTSSRLSPQKGCFWWGVQTRGRGSTREKKRGGLCISAMIRRTIRTNEEKGIENAIGKREGDSDGGNLSFGIMTRGKTSKREKEENQEGRTRGTEKNAEQSR